MKAAQKKGPEEHQRKSPSSSDVKGCRVGTLLKKNFVADASLRVIKDCSK